MPVQDVNFFALNRGEVSELALARVDNQALKLAAEIQENWLPRVLGPMMLRPGTAFVGSIRNHLRCKLIPFIFSATDTAIIELTPNVARFWVNDVQITRPAVSTVMNDFVTAEWVTTIGATSSLVVNGTFDVSNVRENSTSKAVHAMTVALADRTLEHGLRIDVTLGPVEFRIGTTSGGQEIFESKQLKKGLYSIAFTPNVGTVYIQFSSTETLARRLVSSISLDPPGIFSLPTSWGASNFANISYDQSADLVFIACEGLQPQILARYSTNGWAILPYDTFAGPFPAIDGAKGTTFTPSATRGSILVTTNVPFFTQSMAFRQLRLFDDSDQTVSATVISPNSFTEAVRVNGIARDVDNEKTQDRVLKLNISGTWTGTINLQRSFTSATEGFSKVYLGGPSGAGGDFDTNEVNFHFDDDFQNVIAWYRLGVDANKTITGSATVSIYYAKGAGYGYGRITGIASSTVAGVEVLKSFPSANKSAKYWRMSEWGFDVGWPGVVSFHEGRLWFASAGRMFGSVSDQYYSFDDAVTGDSGTINRSIGSGPITNIRWLLSSWRLILGGDTSTISCRSDSLDTPLTPTVFNLKTVSTIGVGKIQPVKVDMRGFYVEQSGRRVLMLNYTQNTFVEQLSDATRLNLDIGVPGFAEMAVIRQPDSRLMLIRNDGQLAILLTEIDEDAAAWVRFTTLGSFENVICIPGLLETKVYVVVNRTINGGTRRYLERFALIHECQGETLNKCMDCHGTYSGPPTTVLSGLTWLESADVVVWADGKEVGFDPAHPEIRHTYRVTGGDITGLPVEVSDAVVGIPYDAVFKSAKLAYFGEGQATAINRVKRVNRLGMLLSNTHYQGVRYGTDGTNLNDLPLVENGAVTPVDTVYSHYDEKAFEFPGNFDTDSRVYITAASPRPATVMGITLGIATN